MHAFWVHPSHAKVLHSWTEMIIQSPISRNKTKIFETFWQPKAVTKYEGLKFCCDACFFCVCVLFLLQAADSSKDMEKTDYSNKSLALLVLSEI